MRDVDYEPIVSTDGLCSAKVRHRPAERQPWSVLVERHRPGVNREIEIKFAVDAVGAEMIAEREIRSWEDGDAWTEA